MDNVTIPDGMPAFKFGAHASPQEGACVMEYCSVLLGQQFSDHPAGINRCVAGFARRANDSFKSDAARSEFLAPLVPRILACTDLQWAEDPAGVGLYARWVWDIVDEAELSVYRAPGPIRYEQQAAAVLLAILDRYEADHPQAQAVRLPGVTAEAIGVV